MVGSSQQESKPETLNEGRHSDLIEKPQVGAEPTPVSTMDSEEQEVPTIDFRRIGLVSLESSELLKVEVGVLDQSAVALIDSGATVSLIRESLVQGTFIDTQQREIISGFGAKSLVTIGTVCLPLVIHGLMMKPSIFRVVDDTSLDFALYLGENFFLENKMDIDMYREKIGVYDRETGYRWELYLGKEEPCMQVFTGVKCVATDQIKIPPKTSVSVPIYLDIPQPPNHKPLQCGTCQPSSTAILYYDGEVETERNKTFVVGEEGILELEETSRVRLYNDSNKARKVQKGDVVGKCFTVIELLEDSIPKVCTVSSINCVDSEEPSRKEDGWTLEKLQQEVVLSDTLVDEEKDRIYDLLMRQHEVLSLGDDDVGLALKGEYRIELYNETPIYQKMRRFPEPVTRAIEEQCEELEELSIIEPSNSPWSSPLVPIKKPDGTVRLCVDYRKLNRVTIADKFPMPNLTDSIYSLHGTKYFTTLDLVRGYYQMEIEPDSREYTAFSTSQGHWQFKRLSFGLKNAPSAFQRLMQEILRKFSRKKVIIYIDDILIMGDNLEDHLRLVEEVLQTLREHGLKVKPGKCHWVKEKVQYLGHMIGRDGIEKSPEYVNRIMNFPKPKTVKEMRSFLGLVNFQRKFVPRCSDIMKPLSVLTGGKKTRKIKWNEERELAFTELKDALQEEVRLSYPEYAETAEPLELFVDASGTGAGAVLTQIQDGILKTIAYDSLAFNDAQRKYSTIERELTAIRWGVKTFKAFLYGQRFVLHTDHQPLVYLHNMQLVDGRLARTLEDLSDFDFEIVYTPGKYNTCADTLSRLHSHVINAPVMSNVTRKLPPGLEVKEVPGGGDCLLKALEICLKWTPGVSLPVGMPKTTNEVREFLVTQLINNLQKYGLAKDRYTKKRVQLMKYPGQLLSQDILLVIADVLKVTVCVHFGGETPIIYQTDSTSGIRIHFQCLAGCHYNAITENIEYEPIEMTSSPIDQHQDELYEEEEEQPIEELHISLGNSILNQPEVSFTCAHNLACKSVIAVQWHYDTYCALVDTGAQVSLLVNQVAIQGGLIIDTPDVGILRGIGEARKTIGQAAQVSFQLSTLRVDNQPFAVVEDDMLPACFVFGGNFLKKNQLIVDYNQQSIRKGSEIIAQLGPTNQVKLVEVGRSIPMENEDPLVVSMATTSVNDKVASNSMSTEIIMRDQLNCSQIKRIRHLIEDSVEKKNLPKSLRAYKRVWNYLVVDNDILYYRRNNKDTPIISFSLLVSMVLHTHVEMAHIGIYKLKSLISQHVWNPSLLKVVKDACMTCSVCQKNKVPSKLLAPPMLKIRTDYPFELVAADLISFSTTPRGYIGCLVVVDHCSKWLSVAPIKNKQSKTIAETMKNLIFPGLIQLPTKMLTDNGPEFVGEPFETMLDEFNIYHVRTTPYKPSSNGAVERVNRTITELLRSLGSSNDWDNRVSNVVRIYNNTTHREIGTSPSSFLLKHRHVIRDNPQVTRTTWNKWKEGHKSFKSFRIGDTVLKKENLTGNQNINKFKPRYTGPYQVIKVNRNGVTYELSEISTNRIIKGHHVQLKKWKQPPQYILNHVSKDKIVEERSNVDSYCPVILGCRSESYSSDTDSTSEDSYTPPITRTKRVRIDLKKQPPVSSQYFPKDGPLKSILKASNEIIVETGFEPGNKQSKDPSFFTDGDVVLQRERDFCTSSPIQTSEGELVSSILPLYVDEWSMSEIDENEGSASASGMSIVPEEDPITGDASKLEHIGHDLVHELESIIENTMDSMEGQASQIEDMAGQMEHHLEATIEEEAENFSGFQETGLQDSKLYRIERLNRLRANLSALRDDIQINRKRQRDRIVQLHRRLSPRSVSYSPPHLRSQGKALDLPLVQPRVLEWCEGSPR